MMRSCLEYAGYALLIFDDPHLEQVFVDRHIGDASRKTQRRKFEIPKIVTKIACFDQKLSKIFKEMYDSRIDFGGHPNPRAMLGAMNLEKSEGEQLISMTTFALAVDPRIIEFSMHKVTQVGLTSQCIFRHIFAERFDCLAIRDEIDALSKEGL